MNNYCEYCGCHLDGNNNYCVNCGHQIMTVNKYRYQENIEDNNTFWWGVLGFFIPIAGFILFLVWINDKPKASKSAGLGALIRVIISIFLTILLFFTFLIGIVSVDEDEEGSVNRNPYSELYEDDTWT